PRRRWPMIVLECGATRVSEVQFSPDGRGLAAVSRGVTHYWEDAVARRPATVLPRLLVRTVRFTPDGHRLLRGGQQDSAVTGLRTQEEPSPPQHRGRRLFKIPPDGQAVVFAQVGWGALSLARGLIFRQPLGDLSRIEWSCEMAVHGLGQPTFLTGDRFV